MDFETLTSAREQKDRQRASAYRSPKVVFPLNIAGDVLGHKTDCGAERSGLEGRVVTHQGGERATDRARTDDLQGHNLAL